MNYKIFFSLLILLLFAFPAHAGEAGSFRLTGVTIKGVKQVDRKALQKTLAAKMPSRLRFWASKPALTEDDIVDDIKKIKLYYQAHGFFSTKIDYTLSPGKKLHRETDSSKQPAPSDLHPSPTHTAKVTFLITEGEPVLVESIDISIKEPSPAVPAINMVSTLPLKKNARLAATEYKETKVVLQKWFGNKGYPFAVVTSKATVQMATKRASVTYVIDPGPQCAFGPLTVSKDSVPIRDQIIERAVTFKEGDIYETRKVEQSQRNLYNLDVFKSARIQADDPVTEKQVVPMSLTLKEKKRHSVKIGIGYGSEDGARLKVGWTRRNIAGWAGRFSVDAKHSDLYEGISATYAQPYFWDARTNLSTGVGTEKEMLDSYDSLETYANLNLTRNVDRHWQVLGGYRLELSKLDDLSITDPKELLAFQDENNYLISSLLFGVVRNKTDDDINPTRGYVFSAMLEAASGLYGSDISFLSPEIELKTYLPTAFQVVFAGRLKAQSILETEDTDHIPIFKRLFLGGSNTVRGYRFQNLGLLDETGNPLGGLSALNANFELRRRLYKSLAGVLFLDMGLLSDDAFDYDFSDMRFSSGAGVRYDTPVGPIRVDVGYKLNPETSKEDRWRIHFSIGHAF